MENAAGRCVIIIIIIISSTSSSSSSLAEAVRRRIDVHRQHTSLQSVAHLHQLVYAAIYTVTHKTPTHSFCDNFGKCPPILITLSLLYSQTKLGRTVI